MARFEDIAFRRPRTDTALLFLLGLFSTWQIVQIAGFPLSTWLAVLTVGYLCLTREWSIRRDGLLLTILGSLVITLAVSMTAKIPVSYKKVSLTGTALWLFVILLAFHVRREDGDRSASAFLRGMDWSCRIQLAWCILQMGLYYVLKLDINAKLFGELLHMNNETSQYRNGILACTGLHWHAANLIPVLVYTYFRHRSIWVKGLCLMLVYLTRNATALIAIAFAVGLDFLSFAKYTVCDKRSSVSRKIMVYTVFGVVAVVLISPVLLPKVREMAQYLLLRVYQIWNPTAGNESSAVHFNYYRHLPHILQNIPAPELIFGSGLNTSGYRFTQFFGQYAESVWTVESDFVNGILNKGLLGVALQYGFLLVLWCRLRKTGQKPMSRLILVLILSGFIYDNQFIWVLMLEYMLYCRTYQVSKERVTHDKPQDFCDRPGL